MTAITYTAERSLAPGHLQGENYEIGIRCVGIEKGLDLDKTARVAKSGRTETITWRSKRIWQVTTAVYDSEDLLEILEFLSSVSQGEAFEFDEFGRPGQPDLPAVVVMDGVYSISRVIRRGDGGRDDGFRFSFTAREL
jgi:hypothetical protein